MTLKEAIRLVKATARGSGVEIWAEVRGQDSHEEKRAFVDATATILNAVIDGGLVKK